MSEPARIGLLGRGTVGGAFHELVADRADAVAATSGRRPEISGVLRRSEGDFDEILAGSDIVVELIGGTDPARDYVLRALAGGQARGHRQQAADRPARRRAVRRGARRRGAAALRGRGRRRRAGDPRDPGEPGRDRDHEGLRDRQRHDQLHPHRDGEDRGRVRGRACRAQELGYAEADPTDDVSGADAAAKMAILARLAFGTPVGLDDVAYEGITDIQPDDLAYAKELGLSLKLLGVAERVEGGVSVRVFPCFLVRRPSARADRGAVQRGDGRGASDHRDHDVRPRRRRARDRDGRAGGRRLDPLRRGAGPRAGRAGRDRARHRLVVLPPPRRSPTVPASSPRSPTCSARTGSRSHAWSSAGPARKLGS